jgi:hypothetical protein
MVAPQVWIPPSQLVPKAGNGEWWIRFQQMFCFTKDVLSTWLAKCRMYCAVSLWVADSTISEANREVNREASSREVVPHHCITIWQKCSLVEYEDIGLAIHQRDVQQYQNKGSWVFMLPSDQEIQYSRYLVNKKYQENLGSHMKSEWIWHDMIMIRVLIHSEGRAWHIAMTLFDVASIQFEPDVVTYGAREHGNTYCGRAVHFLQSTWCTCNCSIWRSWLALDRKLKKH